MGYPLRFAHLVVIGGILALGSATLAPAQAPPPAPVSFYIHAHEDDWQLFMSPDLLQDVKSGRQVVIVYATAGDAGSSAAYWNAREASAQAAESLVAPASGCSQAWACSSATTFAGHPVLRCACGALVAYRMRGPDGSRDGAGYASTHHQSLQRLHCGDITSLTAVDGSTTYTSWSDFVLTLGAIIAYEAHGAGANLHAPDFDATVDPGDHSDHYNTGFAVYQAFLAQAAAGHQAPAWTLQAYVDYDTMNRAANATIDQVAAKAGTFMAYDRKMWQEWDQYQQPSSASTLCGGYKPYSAWLFGIYSRSVSPSSAPPPPLCPAQQAPAATGAGPTP